MKINKFFMGLGAIAALSLAACSNEDPGNPNPEETNGDGTTAYMTVVINTTNGSRGTSGDTDFEQGVDEQAVADANFYFYTKEGAYVTTAQVWDGGEQQTGNVEIQGKTVLVLKDLNEANAPAYIVTVLNKPANFEPGNTLAAMEAKLALAANNPDGYAHTATVNAENKTCFTMSTSSYVREDGAPTYEYFTTKVENAHFLKYKYGETPTQAQIDALSPVNIYVERLAVKVRVGYAADPLTNQVTIGTGDAAKTYFKLTVSGGNITNTEDEGVLIPVADTDLYLGIEGWGLNNLTQNSYMMKNFGYVDEDLWHATNTAKNNFRDYWAKAATIYGVSTPDPLKHYSAANHMNAEGTAFTNTIGASSSAYCFENTNTVAVLKEGNNLGNLATSAMIYARIYVKNGETMTPATMVSYNGIMFSDADFKALLLNAIQTTNKYAYSTDNGTSYHQISANEIQYNAVANNNKGEVTVSLTTTAAGDTYKWYTYTGTINAETSFTASSAATINSALISAIENSLTVTNPGNSTSTTTAHAYMYNGGLMYYNVPIEHYRHSSPQNPLKEGDYGVVRNHIYDLSISGVTKLGKAIYDPENVIIPDTPTEEERFALGVRVNILSWKVVTQNVPL